MKVFNKASQINKWGREHSCRGLSLALVPTMGALHRAHRSLIKRALSENDVTVVSIFVNPTQFGPGEDYGSYPRDFETDRRICEREGADAVFAPPVEEMYTEEEFTSVSVGKLTRHMCGAHRPGHFEGVATVVSKLFNVVRPHRAYFGLKDYQQLRVIEKMNSDLKMGVEVIGCPTVREEDGLALSSRNKYLDKKQRKEAPNIYKALLEGRERLREGGRDGKNISAMLRRLIEKNISGCRIDYAGLYDAGNLQPVGEVKGDVVLAAAVWVGGARLIDNLPVKINE